MGSWGFRGPGGPFDMNYPRHIMVQPANTAAQPGPDHGKRIWLGQERGHHLQVYNYPTSSAATLQRRHGHARRAARPTYVTQIGEIGADNIEPNRFRWPVDLEFYRRADGTEIVVVGDRMANSVKFFLANAPYTEILNPAALLPEDDPNYLDPEDGAPMIPLANHGTAIDPATGNVFVVNPVERPHPRSTTRSASR